MKKIYSAPIVEIEKLDVADIITVSVLGSAESKALAAGVTGGAYTEAVGIEW